MFSAFNLIALAGVSALFIWGLAVAVAGTAHEGTPFGKRSSSLWMQRTILWSTGSGGEYRFIFNGTAGSVTVSCVDEGDALCRGKVNAVGAAVSALSPLAQQLADPDTSASSIEPRALYDAANQVNAIILSGLQSYAQQGLLQGKLNGFREKAAQYGWFAAGSSC